MCTYKAFTINLLLMCLLLVLGFSCQGFWLPNDPNSTGKVTKKQLLDLAIAERWTVFSKYLANYQGEVDITDEYGMTLLIRAAYQKDDVIVRELIKRGANVNQQDKTGVSSLEGAAYSDHLKNVEILLKSEAEVNILNSKKQTPLFTAVRCSSPEIVELLLVHGADPNVVDENGETPLLYAIIPEKKPPLKTIELLLKYGANPNYANPKTGYINTPKGQITLIPGGETALFLAKKSYYTDIIILLEEYGAIARDTDPLTQYDMELEKKIEK